MKLGTRLMLYLSLTIVLVLSGYGYFHIKTRQEVLTQMMRGEVRALGETLRFSLEKISLPKEMIYIQELLDSISEPERTLGVVFYQQSRDLVFRSHSLGEDLKPCLELIQSSIREDRTMEEFGAYQKQPVFFYAFPIRDQKGQTLGAATIVQKTSFIEQDVEDAKRTIFLTLFFLISGTLAWVLFFTRKWVTLPLAELKKGIQDMSRGNLAPRMDTQRKDEVAEVARAFNQMAVDLKAAKERLIEEGLMKLELERNLRESEKLATIGQLASGLAHEIGTPLNIISGRAELMRRRIEDRANLEKNLDIILHQTQRITRIIQQLLGFVRKKAPEQASLNLLPLLESTLDFLDHQTRKQNVTVIKEFQDSLPSLRGDSDQLQQVFLNILLNALQAMPHGGTLRLAVSSKSMAREGLEGFRRDYLEVLVEDTGLGMEEEVRKNIFQPFFTTKEKEKGTGMGLAVSLGIILDHEGWIEVESELGKGSLFKIYIPALESPPLENRSEAGSGEKGENPDERKSFGR
jgi:signal transduction histidine kinase